MMNLILNLILFFLFFNLAATNPDSHHWTIFLFVDVALRVASILKNHYSLYLLNVLHIAKHVYLLGFEHHE